jgi:hypothetical protein
MNLSLLFDAFNYSPFALTLANRPQDLDHPQVRFTGRNVSQIRRRDEFNPDAGQTPRTRPLSMSSQAWEKDQLLSLVLHELAAIRPLPDQIPNANRSVIHPETVLSSGRQVI